MMKTLEGSDGSDEGGSDLKRLENEGYDSLTNDRRLCIFVFPALIWRATLKMKDNIDLYRRQFCWFPTEMWSFRLHVLTCCGGGDVHRFRWWRLTFPAVVSGVLFSHKTMIIKVVSKVKTRRKVVEGYVKSYRNIIGEQKTSLEHVDSTSRIGCSTRDKECGGEHEYNIQKLLEEKHGVMYGRGIRQSYTGDTRESIAGSNYILHGVRCVKGNGACNDDVRSNNGSKNVKIYANENGYHNIKNNMITNNITNIDSNNGSNNTIGSGSNNGDINGSSDINGTDNIPGSGNNNPIIVSIGDYNGNNNDNVNPGSGGHTGHNL
ncbi:unnamed protein product [Lactuca saligna]|uniref:Uncharacterized protein n=1 Tax=Lactuca saligna TaxID=75948 RepID=A0AA35YBY4_LACSI|nr:unnamed protein product [Lactuca saligna]